MNEITGSVRQSVIRILMASASVSFNGTIRLYPITVPLYISQKVPPRFASTEIPEKTESPQYTKCVLRRLNGYYIRNLTWAKTRKTKIPRRAIMRIEVFVWCR